MLWRIVVVSSSTSVVLHQFVHAGDLLVALLHLMVSFSVLKH